MTRYKKEFKLNKRDGYNSKLYDVINKKDEDGNIKNRDIFFQKKRSSKSPSILAKDNLDEEELKKQILNKKRNR